MLNRNWSAAYYQNDTYSGNHTRSTVSSQTYPTTWATVNAIIHIFALLTNLVFVVVVIADKASLAGPRLLILNLAVCGLVLSAGGFQLHQSFPTCLKSAYHLPARSLPVLSSSLRLPTGQTYLLRSTALWPYAIRITTANSILAKYHV